MALPSSTLRAYAPRRSGAETPLRIVSLREAVGAAMPRCPRGRRSVVTATRLHMPHGLYLSWLIERL